MTEIELKFQVPRQRREALAKAVGTATASRVRLQAHYFDSADRRLAQARLALRVRKEGRRWVQTLKGAGDGLWQRLEHEVPLVVAPGQVPVADPALHDGTPAGEALRAALGDASLVSVYGTDVRRCLRLLRAPGCSVELAFDQGALQASGEQWPLCELELELKAGDAVAMAQLAARWVTRFGLTLDTRTKSERGDRLARGVRIGEPVKAQPVRLTADVDSHTALRAIIGNAMAQVLGNASDMAHEPMWLGHFAHTPPGGGRGRRRPGGADQESSVLRTAASALRTERAAHGGISPEHLHQLRVGLRRLRTALRELAGLLPSAKPEWDEALAQVFARLGAARDIDALAQTLLPLLRKAGAGELTLPASDDAAPPELVLREPATQVLWLELLACAAGGGVGPEPFAPLLRERVQRLYQKVRRDAKRFAAIDDNARHQLRKRIKRLRYLCDYAAGLHDKRSVKAFMKPLALTQDALGAYNDVCVARALFDRVAAHDRQAMFALGWLAHERDSAISRCVAALQLLRKAPVFW